MPIQEVVVYFPSKVIRNLDALAVQRRIKREEAVVELVEESLHRQQARATILRAMARRQVSPRWNKAFQRLARLRNKVKETPDKELKEDIEAAVRDAHDNSKD